ncbi:hypothetical protein D3C78_1301830 [compost metagenome]
MDRLRLQPAIQHLVQPDRGRAAGPRRAGRVHRAADRGPRTGRGGMDTQAPARIPAGAGRQRLPAQGIGACAVLQRAAGDGQTDPRCPGRAGLPRLRSAGDRQQHQGPGRVGAAQGPLRETRRALQVLPRRAPGRFQGRRTELPDPAHRQGRRSDRGDRLGLLRRPQLAQAHGAALRRPENRRGAVATGLPRPERKYLQEALLRGIQGLLPHRHGHPQRP